MASFGQIELIEHPGMPSALVDAESFVELVSGVEICCVFILFIFQVGLIGSFVHWLLRGGKIVLGAIVYFGSVDIIDIVMKIYIFSGRKFMIG